MNCVILQPSYIPWRGYFHQIQKADLFIFYDDVQYDHHGWRNRNKIKTPTGPTWLTIPVSSKGRMSKHTLIKDTTIVWNKDWNSTHYAVIKQFYRNAPFYDQYEPLLREFYSCRPERLADFTIETTIALASELGISSTKFMRSSELAIEGTKTDRLVNILKTVGANHYISGPSAKDYIQDENFSEAGISLEYMVYDYPPYPQLYGAFEPYVSIFDLLFMVGSDAPKYIWDANE